MKHKILALLLTVTAFCGCSDRNAAPETETGTVQSVETAVTPAPQEESFESFVCFFNVGKADAALLVSQGDAYLLDTGTEESVPALLGALHTLGIERLSGIVLSHSHKDHTGGVEAILANMPVGRVLYPALCADEKKIAHIQEQCRERGIPTQILSAGDTLSFGSMSCTVLAPLSPAEDENDRSLVIMAEVSGRRILLMGDAQFAEEQSLLRAGADLKADILKVGNHGNPDATGNALAEAVSPAWAVISTDTSVDKNSASERVQAALSGAKIKLTQMTEVGYCFRIGSLGSLDMSEIQRASKDDALSIESPDAEHQTVALVNAAGHDVDLTGWMIFEKKNGKLFRFPEGAQIKTGQRITVAAKGKTGDYNWPEDEVWKKKNETAMLFDPYGNLADQKPVSSK